MKPTLSMLSLPVLVSMVLAACTSQSATPSIAPATEVPAEPTAPPPAFVCADAIGCVDVAPGDPIHVAWALTVSGATATLGEDSRGAIEIAIDDRGGELLGHPIDLT